MSDAILIAFGSLALLISTFGIWHHGYAKGYLKGRQDKLDETQ